MEEQTPAGTTSSAETFDCTIIFGGDPAAGKSTAIKALLALLKDYGYSCLDMGQIRRDKAEGMGITLVELNQRAEKDFSIDNELEEIMKKKLTENPRYIVTTRTAAHLFSPDQFGGSMLKIYLKVDSSVGA